MARVLVNDGSNWAILELPLGINEKYMWPADAVYKSHVIFDLDTLELHKCKIGGTPTELATLLSTAERTAPTATVANSSVTGTNYRTWTASNGFNLKVRVSRTIAPFPRMFPDDDAVDMIGIDTPEKAATKK